MKTLTLASIQSMYFLFAAVFFSVATSVQADFTLEIAQTSRLNVFGSMTILDPRSRQFIVPEPSFTISDYNAGRYTIVIDPPAGTTTNSSVFVNGVKLEDEEGVRLSFTAADNDEVFVQVEHEYTRTGTVTVNTEPRGFEFTLTGPDKLTWKSTTPAEYTDLPEGQYSVQFTPPPGCGTPRALSDRFLKGGRINFTLDFSCKEADIIREEQYNTENPDHFTVKVNGNLIPFYDIQKNDWFAPYVTKVVEGGILEGYKNEAGEAVGTFGPGDSVNLAQLAKVAHKIASISTDTVRTEPQNVRARGTWFEDFIASAELQLWIPFLNPSEDLARPATRGEVISTLLQALDKKTEWPTGTFFTDVTPHTRYSYAIERAAIDGLVDTSTTLFRPSDPINRAELAKVLATVIDLYILAE